tara:strand:- start:2624 stop:3136 length:513 start_codon:yes stop_codon:yes gene_type:complete
MPVNSITSQITRSPTSTLPDTSKTISTIKSYPFLQPGSGRVIEYPHLEIDKPLSFQEILKCMWNIRITLGYQLDIISKYYEPNTYTSELNGQWNAVISIMVDGKELTYIIHRALDQGKTYCGPIKHGHYQFNLNHHPLNEENAPEAYKKIEEVILKWVPNTKIITEFNLK